MPRRRRKAELIAQFRAGALLLADAGATEFPPGDYGGLNVHASLREAAKDYDPENQTDVSLTCRPPGVIYSMQGPFPIEIFEGRDLIVIKLEYFDLVRIIFMNETRASRRLAALADRPFGRPLGRRHAGRRYGQAAARHAVQQRRRLHGNVRLVERFRLADANTLIVTQQFEDPGSFEGTAARIMSFRRGDDHVYPYDCDPTYGLAIDSRQGPQ